MNNNPIKKLRKLSGLTQKKFADKVGTTQSYLSQLENGLFSLNIVTFQEWCETIGVEDYNEVFEINKNEKN